MFAFVVGALLLLVSRHKASHTVSTTNNSTANTDHRTTTHLPAPDVCGDGVMLDKDDEDKEDKDAVVDKTEEDEEEDEGDDDDVFVVVVVDDDDDDDDDDDNDDDDDDDDDDDEDGEGKPTSTCVALHNTSRPSSRSPPVGHFC